MDAPRRWQAASLVTAVASLGLGGALLAQPAVETVPSIDLDQIDATLHPGLEPPLPVRRSTDDQTPLIVLPRSLPEGSVSASEASVASPDEAGATPSDTRSSGRPAAPTPPSPEPSPVSIDDDDGPASAHSGDSPASVDSVDSSD